MNGNEKNLIPNSERTKEERIEIAKAGGIASGKARRRRKQIKEDLEMILSLPIKNGRIKDQLKALGIEDEEMTNQMAMTIALWQKAIKGDVSAFNSLRDTVGEKPVDVQQVQEVPIIKDDV